jgi:hypothetical protein
MQPLHLSHCGSRFTWRCLVSFAVFVSECADCPHRRRRLESRTLLPNVALRSAIEEYFSGFAKQNANQIEFHELELVSEIAVARSKSVYEGL